MSTTEIAKGRTARDDYDNESWPGIVSRFQLVILAGRRSKQLLKGALPRIPADPLKRRNTSIALEELRRGLVPFKGGNLDEPQAISPLVDTVVNVAGLELSKVE